MSILKNKKLVGFASGATVLVWIFVSFLWNIITLLTRRVSGDGFLDTVGRIFTWFGGFEFFFTWVLLLLAAVIIVFSGLGKKGPLAEKMAGGENLLWIIFFVLAGKFLLAFFEGFDNVVDGILHDYSGSIWNGVCKFASVLAGLAFVALALTVKGCEKVKKFWYAGGALFLIYTIADIFVKIVAGISGHNYVDFLTIVAVIPNGILAVALAAIGLWASIPEEN